MTQPDIIANDPIVTRLFDALNALVSNNPTPWAEMFALDGAMEFPYAPPGYPDRLDGRGAILAYMVDYPNHVALHRIDCDSVHCAGETRIVEFRAHATAVASGRPFTMRYVAIITLAGDRVKTYRDYWNPLVALTAIGDTKALLSLGTGAKQ